MRIGVFAYNFEHKKTQEGLLHLFLNGYKPECIFAANPVKLNFYQSKIRVTPKNLSYEHPRKVAKKLRIPYHVVVHNSKDCVKLVKKFKLDLGIILGARILKSDVINTFKIGVLNMHPGMLPDNRGLDNLKWAILKNFPQGVSCHLIDRHVDKGNLIVQEQIPVFNDDTLVDIFLRIQNKELQLMIKSIEILNKRKVNFQVVDDGNYFKAVPLKLEKTLLKKFENYKKNYANIANKYGLK